MDSFGVNRRLTSVLLLVFCCQRCYPQDQPPCKSGECIAALTCPVLRPALNLNNRSNSRQVIDIIKRHRCGNRESRRLCCTDLATDLIRARIFADFNDDNSTDTVANLMTTPCSVSNDSDLFPNEELTLLFEYSWSALLEYNTSIGRMFLCGGSLINERYVLTAAHCLILPDTHLVNVRLGEYDTSSEMDCTLIGSDTNCFPPVEKYDVDEVVIHQAFKVESFLNDIALIRLKQKVQFRDRIRPICLPLTKALKEAGTLPIVAGWGINIYGKPSKQLQKAEVQIQPNSFCSTMFKRNFTPSQLCVEGINELDTCKGDSGGALFGKATGSHKYVQYGVLSALGGICDSSGNATVPSIYTKVVDYVPWIIKNIRS